MKLFLEKLKESASSILPVAVIVFLLDLTPLVSLSVSEMTVFGCGALASVLGIALFNLGADFAMMPMGNHIGSGLSKSRSPLLMISVCALMGFFITVAEPDLSVLAEQVSSAVNGTLLVVLIALGVAVFLVIAVLKIIYRVPLTALLQFFYMLLFGILIFVLLTDNQAFIPVALDSGGVTTGPITVPFIMALGIGIANTIGGKNKGENSFGLVSLCSVGPVIAVAVLGIFARGNVDYSVGDYGIPERFLPAMGAALWENTKSVLIALSLILGFFILLQFFFLKLPANKLRQIFVGALFTFAGLVVFLSAVSLGFMPVGYKIGAQLAERPPVLVCFGTLIGAVVVLAEPAVRILTAQVEEITGNGVSRRSMMIALSVGVGISIGLSMLRAVCGFSILWYIVPGYLIAVLLSVFVPGVYTAIAFDSGGVASGPLSSGFILPLSVGACMTLGGEELVMSNAFGVIAMIAMTPLIMVQLLGFRSLVVRVIAKKRAKKRILEADDERIILFD